MFVLVAVNIPAEVCDKEEEAYWKELWCYNLLQNLANELKLPSSSVSAYIPMLLTGIKYRDLGCERREEFVVPYLSILWNKNLTPIKIYAQMLIYLFEEGLLDGRGRVLLRNISLSLQLCGKETMWVDNILLTFLLQQQAGIDHAKQVQSDRFRYAKIGAVAIGAGAAIAFTAGLAAPAVAGALLVLGASATTAATLAGSMALIFGGTGAGLAGYKMLKRTRGLTDFEFFQYDEKSRTSVMIMVSGWMEEDEDDKRTFGVVPSDKNISLKERLVRYYRIHDPARLLDVEKNLWDFCEDPAPLFAALKKRYGKDPLDAESLVPPLPSPDAERAAEALDVITQCFQAIAESHTEAETVAAAAAAKNTKPSMFSFSRTVAPVLTPATAALSVATPPAPTSPVRPTPTQPTAYSTVPVGSSRSPRGTNNDADTGMETVGSPHVDGKEAAVSAMSPAKGVSQQSQSQDQDNEKEHAVQEWDHQQERLSLDQQPVSLAEGFKYWHWRELSISPAYELTLLRWELQTQKDLGRSILDLITGLSKQAAKEALQYTTAGLLLAAISLPMTLISLLDVIDNLWLLAEERADIAGKELAKALLERPHGQRPVTLVGYSMGCRVIFSCLKELADRLHVAHPAPVVDEEHQQDKTEPSQSQNNARTNHLEEEEPIETASPVCNMKLDTDHAPVPSKAASSASTAAAPAPQPRPMASSFMSSMGNIGSKMSSMSNMSNVSTTKEKKVEEKSINLLPRELKGLVSDVVLLGAPLQLRDPNWARIRAVVGGRIVNGYSTADLVLSVIYRYQRYKILGCSGIAPVKAEGIENINLTHIVSQHVDYNLKMKEILEEIDLTSTHAHTGVYGGFDAY
eukprot:gene10520-12287_t